MQFYIINFSTTHIMQLKLLFFIISLILYLPIYGQVTIGSNLTPNHGALLDLKERSDLEDNSARGLVLPRVGLKSLTIQTGTSLNATIEGATGTWDKDIHTGLTVYNVNKANACNNFPDEGVYSWDGDEWIDLWRDKLIRPALGPGTDKYKGANTYIVMKGRSVEIPVMRAFDIWTDYAGSDKTEGRILQPLTVFGPGFPSVAGAQISYTIAWQEALDNTSADVLDAVSPVVINNPTAHAAASFTVKAGTKEGNALVQIHYGTTGTNADPVLWQWQIWVPLDNPETQAYGYNTGGHIYWFMDRFLGAVSSVKKKWDGDQDGQNGTARNRDAHGLFYQWGRSTPFRKFGVTTPNYTPNPASSTNERDNLLLAIQTPIFIKGFAGTGDDPNPAGNSTAEDWYSDVLNIWATRWGDGSYDEQGDKTGFDPCPEGWRVPSWKENLSPWNCLDKSATLVTDTYSGYNFTDPNRILGYYPSVGYRVRSNGALYDVGNVATSWTASPFPSGAGRGARRLFFDIRNTPAIYPNSSHSMANGLGVRCIQDR